MSSDDRMFGLRLVRVEPHIDDIVYRGSYLYASIMGFEDIPNGTGKGRTYVILDNGWKLLVADKYTDLLKRYNDFGEIKGFAQ